MRSMATTAFVLLVSLAPIAVSAAPQFCGGTAAQTGMDLGTRPGANSAHTSSLIALTAIVTSTSESPPDGWLALDDRAQLWIQFRNPHGALRAAYGNNAVVVSKDGLFYAVKGEAPLPRGYQLEDCESAALPGSDSE
jgi:hypothetical protein